MIGRLRSSFAAKLFVAGIVLALAIVGSVSAYLLISRDRQTRVAALSNADNRTAVMVQVLDRFTGAQGLSAAQGLASQGALAASLGLPDAVPRLQALFAGPVSVDLSGQILVITDRSGRIVYSRTSPDLSPVNIAPVTAPGSLLAAAATGGPGCTVAGTRAAGACGVELLDGRLPSYDVAVPVLLGGRPAGAVGYLAPLGVQLDRFKGLFQYPTAFIPVGSPDRVIRLGQAGDVFGETPDEVRPGIHAGDQTVHATYSAPSGPSGVEEVSGSFAAVRAPDGSIAGYMGVEVPLSVFGADTRTDELTLLVITVGFLLIIALAVALFVNRAVRAPVARLERGVARIARGDYGTPIDVRSRDELGRLAADVNRMRDSIASYVRQIEEGRARLDRAVERMSDVSRALTTTTAGVPALQRAVVRTAAEIAGPGSQALLAVCEGPDLRTQAAHPEAAETPSLELGVAAEILSGRPSRRDGGGGGAAGRPLLAVPMFYQRRVVGAVAAMAPHGGPALGEDAEAVLTVLANNAAVALENTRLFEQEREMVRRLRELDAMKSDFLATVQHELRTPLTAILGLSDLMEMCWDMWDETPKLDAIRDIQVAAKNLYDIVETMIDFAMLEDEAFAVEREPIPVRPVVEAAVAGVADRIRGGLPIPVEIDGGEELAVWADRPRFQQAVRALVDNAIKFSDGRGRVRVVIADEPPEHVRLEIADEGVGIPEDEVGRIFDRFYQVDNTTTRRYGGTGMGLALVRRVAEAHEARIEVRSTEGRGSSFILHWPSGPAAVAP